MIPNLAFGIGLFYFVVCLTIAIMPDWFFTVVDWRSQQGLYTAAAIRIVVGIVFLLAASSSRFPKFFRVLGAVVLVVGLLLPVMPMHAWYETMQWWMVDSRDLFRGMVIFVGIPFGVFVMWAFAQKGSVNAEIEPGSAAA